MPTFDDIVAGAVDVAGAADNGKQQLQEALLELLKGNPDILESVSKLSQSNGQQATEETLQPLNQKASEGVRKPKRSQPFSEVQNSLNRSLRDEHQWMLSDKDDGNIDSAWSSATRNMSPRELAKWRKGLYSVFVGHLPVDITKRELMQLFSEVGSVQDTHIQPASCGAYTYGFVRYSTLDECRDAVAKLHGRMLGNRTICVEYACETKRRLEHGDDPDDLPLDKNDKLLRREYPSVNFRPMSEEESQEKIILWKLRSSATKLMSSQAGCVQDRQDSSKGETLMDKIQELVKKVVGLPADALASPTASEGSPFSSWILSRNDNKSEMETDKQKCGLQDHSDLIEGTKEMSSGSIYKEEKSARTVLADQSPFKEQKMSMSRNNGSAPCTFSPEHSPETFAAPNSHIHNNSGLSEGGFSPGCGNSSFSELDTTASDSFSIASLSPDRSLKKRHSLDESQVEVATPRSIETLLTVRFSEENANLCKEDHVEQNPSGNQSNHGEPSLQHYEVRRGECGRQKVDKMGICNFDVSDPYAYVQRSLPCKEQPVEKVNEHSTADCAMATTASSASIQPEQMLLEMPHVTGVADCQNCMVNNCNMVRSNCNRSQSLQVGSTNLTPLVSDCKRVGQSSQPDGQKDPILAVFPANDKQKKKLQDINNNKFKGASCTPETEAVDKEVEPCLRKNQADSNKRQNLSLPALGLQRPCTPITVNGTKLVVQGSPNVNSPAASHSPLCQQSSYTARTNNIDRMNLGLHRPPFGIPPILAQQLLNQLSLNQLNQINSNLLFQQQLAASVFGIRPPFYPGVFPCSNLGAPFANPTGWSKGSHWFHGKPKIGPSHAHDRQHQHTRGATPVITDQPPGRKPSPRNASLGSHIPLAGQDSVELKDCDSKPSPQSIIIKETSPIKHTTGASPKSPTVKMEGDVESPVRKATPSPKPSQNELYLKELQAELDCVLKENRELRQHVYRQRSERGCKTHNDQKQEALESIIHSKELQLQKEKEIIMARSADQELLYEREKLEAAFDQQLMRELEVEQQIGETKNRLHLAKLESELLPLYQLLHDNTDVTG